MSLNALDFLIVKEMDFVITSGDPRPGENMAGTLDVYEVSNVFIKAEGDLLLKKWPRAL